MRYNAVVRPLRPYAPTPSRIARLLIDAFDDLFLVLAG
jgi:hypothetical protein